jgi:(E)-4-hydroxy-3-methyl-but-2-enyl pyrophosphate reductase
MTRIKLAKNAGFCMGVRRAVNMALEAAKKKNGPICTCGPLIHNPQVLRILEGKGIKSIPGDAGRVSSPETSSYSTIIIRAHGLSPQERRTLKETGARIIDATCPHVGKVQGIIRRYAQEGYATIIVGESDHAEVIGLMGYAQGNGHVVNRLEDVDSLPPLDKVCMVAQTTQDRSLFQAVAEKVERKYPGVKIFNTLCDSTRQRQDEASNLAKKVNAMVVVGGRESGNTRRLAQISEAAGIPTFLVE